MANEIFLDRKGGIVYNVSIVAELLGTFEQAVLLSVVRLRDEAYGRAILRSLEEAVERKVTAGAIYATLDRLEEKGLLSSTLSEGTPVRGGRARRYYGITAAGIQGLNEARETLNRMWRRTRFPIEVKA